MIGFLADFWRVSTRSSAVLGHQVSRVDIQLLSFRSAYASRDRMLIRRRRPSLPICGATGRDWLGLSVHCRFETMIVQTENGRYRSRDEYRARGLASEIEDYILVSEPPPYGLTLGHREFQSD
jgi:hypothetical protein